MANLKWLLEDGDFDEYVDLYYFFLDNGIFSESSAKDIFLDTRFPKYPLTDCPFCYFEGDNYILKDNRFKCKKCFKKFSVTSRTYLDNVKLKEYQILRLLHLVFDKGIKNSCYIARDINITQKSSFNTIQKINKSILIDHKTIDSDKALFILLENH